MRRIWSYFSIVILLIIAVYCEFQVNDSLVNACLDVAVTFVVFFLGYNDSKKKITSQQTQIKELQNRIAQLETGSAEHNNPDEVETSKPQTKKILWEYAIKK